MQAVIQAVIESYVLAPKPQAHQREKEWGGDERARLFAVRLLAEVEGAAYYALNDEECEQLANVLRYALYAHQAKPEEGGDG